IAGGYLNRPLPILIQHGEPFVGRRLGPFFIVEDDVKKAGISPVGRSELGGLGVGPLDELRPGHGVAGFAGGGGGRAGRGRGVGGGGGGGGGGGAGGGGGRWGGGWGGGPGRRGVGPANGRWGRRRGEGRRWGRDSTPRPFWRLPRPWPPPPWRRRAA